MTSNSNSNANRGLFAKIFNKDKSKSPSTAADTSDTASTMTGDTLVNQNQSSSTSDDNNVGGLMSQAQGRSPEELKAYLAQHKEETEAKYRKQGGGVAGGDWVSTGDATTEMFRIRLISRDK
ncbi:hypothetical protein PV11_06255 [Exophiala sideris]|uniref:Uncharacterized protein n=1 Tax=Exophiala sideris TaxID=1016849 RepID=A0A0D1WU10_9EURO|nr:hypothetical protein PV11_06255 [Exophiala sideris]